LIKAFSPLRIVVLLVIVVLVVSCGGAQPATTTATTTSTTTTTTTPPAMTTTTPPAMTTTTPLAMTTTTPPATTTTTTTTTQTTATQATTTPMTTTTTTTTPITTTATPTITWGEFARNNAFAICASCHGSTGEGGYGPALIGSNANLNTFGTAQRLLDYISEQMPQGAPGSLSDLEYLKILALLLIENSIVQAEAIFDADNLANVPLS